ncbi:protein-disulfide reductase DsbD family protein [Rhodothermus profundi]|uniref:Thiol:disulfide interchange protein DsbD n=1 Tax=Rhodothermus profundi TaxID=633813 RepID=A0A1M6Q5Q5_9BACT|nr:cytochrome c biogenesis protein CcdA [Rhodothermus profundi]SHK15480.1 thiol:disulfide interchange protein DsbD [Rhodothermus profundi]
MRGNKSLQYIWLVLLGVLVQPVQAQRATELVQWRARVQPEAVAPGDSLWLRLEATIAAGWKMYALDSPPPTKGVRLLVDALPEGIRQAGDPLQQPPLEGYDPFFQKVVRYFMDQAALALPLVAAPDARPGTRRIRVQVEFTICNDRICLPPTKVPVEAAVRIDPQAATVATPPRFEPVVPPIEPEPSTPALAETPLLTDAAAQDLARARSGGLWGFLLLAVGAGLAALLTPCVFPMIPLTVSFFTRQGGSRAQAVRLALVYGMAIVVTFTGLGVLTALLVGASGAQTIAANPWINLFIGLVFVLFALSLLGLYELRLPSGLVNYFNRQSQTHGGYLGALFMGLTLTLVSFSCTAPFVGGLLAATALGEWGYPVLGMVTFSLTFALPFVLFALFPRALEALPRSGSWMHTIKVVLGFVELAAALKFLSNADLVWGWGVLSRPLVIALVSVLFFLTGLYLIGKLRLPHEPLVETVGVGRLLVAVLFFGMSLYMLPGLLGAPLGNLDAYLPPRRATDVGLVTLLQASSASENRTELSWHEEVETAFAEAQAIGRPVFIDFTGYTCTNCRQMEATVFPHPEVARRLQNDFVRLRLYTDDASVGPEWQRYQLQLTGTVALPTYAIVAPAGQPLLARHTGLASVEEFIAFLEEGRRAFQQWLAQQQRQDMSEPTAAMR